MGRDENSAMAFASSSSRMSQSSMLINAEALFSRFASPQSERLSVERVYEARVRRELEADGVKRLTHAPRFGYDEVNAAHELLCQRVYTYECT